MSPIIPFNTEFFYLNSKFDKKKSIFMEKWPLYNLQELKFNEEIIQKIEILKNVKHSARRIFLDEKMLKSGYTGYKFKIVLCPTTTHESVKKKKHTERGKELLENVFGDFQDCLKEIMECSEFVIDTTDQYRDEEPKRAEIISFVYRGFRIKLKMKFFVISQKGECSRCFRYTREDPDSNFCGECESSVNEDLRELYSEYFNLN